MSLRTWASLNPAVLLCIQEQLEYNPCPLSLGGYLLAWMGLLHVHFLM